MRIFFSSILLGCLLIAISAADPEHEVKPEFRRPDGPPTDPEEPDPFGEGEPFELTDDGEAGMAAAPVEMAETADPTETAEMEHGMEREKMDSLNNEDTKAVMPKHTKGPIALQPPADIEHQMPHVDHIHNGHLDHHMNHDGHEGHENHDGHMDFMDHEMDHHHHPMTHDGNVKHQMEHENHDSQVDSTAQIVEKDTTPLPEPAIKFDNIETEDYGDEEEKEKNAKPDAINTEVIEQLVDKFLNNGSIADSSSGPKFANPAAQALIGGEYWEVDGLEEPGTIKDQDELIAWLEGYGREAGKVLREVAAAGWRYFSNASPIAKQALSEAENVMSKFVRATSRQARQFDVSAITDPAIKKQILFVSFEGMVALGPKKYNKFNEAQAKLNRVAANTDVCDIDMPPPCALKRADLQSIFTMERNSSRLAHLWVNYVKQMAQVKQHYTQLISLSNEGAEANGFSNAGEMWRSAFDMSSPGGKPAFDLRQKLNEIYTAIKPLYELLHAYFRRHLAGIYENPADMTKGGPIPAHLFGSLEGNDWSAHFEQTKPYEEESQMAEDMLDAFRHQNYTAKEMFIKAYRYFKSIGFPRLPKTFWTNSIFARVWSRDMICNPPAAVDMRDGRDYRVKVCAQLGEPDFELAHSLMAQSYYQLLYRKQPLLFREVASPVISDGIAKVFSRLATNPHYLYSQKLVPSNHLDIKDSLVINRLYKEALMHIPRMPFSLAADEWRYELLENKIMAGNENDRWWQLRNKYEGIKAPQPYNMSVLDALMHSAIFEEHSPATKDMISYIVQFQILKALCPEGTILSEGCILSEDTTTNLRNAMKLGSSASWLDALKTITGKNELDPQPMLEYFEPLTNWLQNTNEIDQVIVGWENSDGSRFELEELPKPMTDMDTGTGILSEDRIAYPGGECTGGQECLLDSTCNGTVCVCNEGLYTLIIGNTFNCVPGNPADKGFGDGKSEDSIVIGLYAVTTTTPKVTTTSVNPHAHHKHDHSSRESAVSSTNSLIALCVAMFLYVSLAEW